jgi:hypothetical protein
MIQKARKKLYGLSTRFGSCLVAGASIRQAIAHRRIRGAPEVPSSLIAPHAAPRQREFTYAKWRIDVK